MNAVSAPPRISDETWCRNTAEIVDVDFLSEIDPSTLVLQDADGLLVLQRREPLVAAYLGLQYSNASFLLGPSQAASQKTMRLAAQPHTVRRRFRIVPLALLRRAIFQRAAPLLTRTAVYGLFDTRPQFSARITATTAQAVLFTATGLGLLWLILFFPGTALDGLRVVATLAFFGCTMLRILAACQGNARQRALPPPPDGEMPVYSVLVALRNEAALVPQLLTALSRISWPRDRLEIKLICEADDDATIAAIRAHVLRDSVEVIEVPPSAPRTKPKALRYALQATTGEYVVLYDAEDIPHPDQLHEAWRRFSAAGPELACLQAPLDISNGRASWIAEIFAFEYAGLFRCLLPWLADRRTILPLGGTSNHFRRTALDDVGAWDPHNVTEDADLGIRLARFGYRCDLLAKPTREEAPESFAVWRPQRTRWSKGWLQTWLVHMRNPVQLARDLGPGSFVLTQILLLGIVFSALVYPILVFTSVWAISAIVTGEAVSSREYFLLCLDLFNIICSFGAFIAIGAIGQAPLERKVSIRILCGLPVYWLMMSAAAWLAVFEIWWRPFHWHKTPHKPGRTLIRTERAAS